MGYLIKALPFVAVLFTATAAHAGFAVQCDVYDPCSGPGGDPGLVAVDYTVPFSGLGEKWTFYINNGDPNATLTLDSPNEIFSIRYFRDAGGAIDEQFSGQPTGPWSMTAVSSPGRLVIRTYGPRNWDDCGNPAHLGLCGVFNAIWGNGTALHISTDRPWSLGWSLTTLAAPEPATWATLVLGLAAVGGAIRRTRRSARLVG